MFNSKDQAYNIILVVIELLWSEGISWLVDQCQPVTLSVRFSISWLAIQPAVSQPVSKKFHKFFFAQSKHSGSY